MSRRGKKTKGSFKAFSKRGGFPAALMTRRKGEEIKSVDVLPAVMSQAISTTAVFTLLNPVQEGSSFYNRVGRRITMKSLLLQGYIVTTESNAAPTVEDYMRLMVIYDRQPNGTFPVLADVLTSYNNAGATSSTSLDQINMNNRDRFHVLVDQRTYLHPVGADGVLSTVSGTTYEKNGSGQQQTYNIKKFIKLRNLETHYKASSNPAVIGDQATGALFLMIVGYAVAVGNAAFNFVGQSRLRYIDD